MHCPHCGHENPIDKWKPVEPYHDVSAVAKLLETTPNYIRKWICTEPCLRAYPQIYRKGSAGRLIRVLPESMMRKMLAWKHRKILGYPRRTR